MPKKSKLKTKNRPAADLDQVAADIESPARSNALLYQPPDDDLPGGGQYYCVTCAKHLTDRKALLDHRRAKPHKARLRALAEAPYSQAEADAAGGLGAYKRPRAKRAVAEPLKPELGLLAAAQGPPPAKSARTGTAPEAMNTGTKGL